MTDYLNNERVKAARDVHVLPQFPGEPKHIEDGPCWFKPQITHYPQSSLYVHRCLTRPEENTVTDRVEVS